MLPITLDQLIEGTSNIVINIVDQLLDEYAYAFETGALGVINPSGKLQSNKTREIDARTHGAYKRLIRKHIGFFIETSGEEESEKLEGYGKEKNIIASIDALDGTDLYARGFSNWCTALFYFIPNSLPDSKVLASFVGAPVDAILHAKERGAPSGIVYYASEQGAYKIDVFEGDRRGPEKLEIPETERNVSLKDAAICFYGQKATNMLVYCQNEPFMNMLREFSRMERQADEIKKAKENLIKENKHSEAEELDKKFVPVDFRIYNLAGNPMMVRLAEGRVHVVMDINGQDLYDVIPGAYIARKAGAFWGDLEGNEITDKYLQEKYLMRSSREKMKYIIATSKSLYYEVLRYIK